MIEKGLYYIDKSFAQLIMSLGGEWKDTKHRPVVCLMKSTESDKLLWAIPMGKYNHRNREQIERIERFLNYDESDLRSCYYHIGRTTAKSIFFISDAIPITDKYIKEEHIGANKKHYVIHNPKLIAELQRKLLRILSMENSKNNYFRQHITDVKKYLLNEIAQKHTNDMYKMNDSAVTTTNSNDAYLINKA